MSSPPPVLGAPIATRGDRRLTRGIAVAWWYTVVGVMFFEFMLVFVWVTAALALGLGVGVITTVGVGGLVWVAATYPLLQDYRHRSHDGPMASWRALGPFLIAAVYGVVVGVLTGTWFMGALPLAQFLLLLNWPAGMRVRVVAIVTVALGGVWILDMRPLLEADRGFNVWFLGLYSVMLPAVTVLSLWWWDVLFLLDRARASDARLAATQERLRVATDVHDLQGHHLQVIALQLELADRLLERDPTEAAAHLRAARASVDEARQGTRDLALRFRSVPLGDEIANAVDLLRAAGTSAEAAVAADAADAPGDVLGPVIRETTTNVLRHGGGRRASLSLTRTGGAWRYEISNDADAAGPPAGDGSGLDGIRRRAEDAGGTLEVRRERRMFVVVVEVPDLAEGVR